jgi:hypothetical protein
MGTGNRRHILHGGLTSIALAWLATAAVVPGPAAAQRDDPAAKNASKAAEAKRPKLVLRAQPSVGVAPLRVTFSGELQGGADDFEEYYCPTIEWTWGDDTSSESTTDCDPYAAGKSQVKRRYTTQHLFRREGPYKVYLHLKRKDKIVGTASATVQVQPGGSGPF